MLLFLINLYLFIISNLWRNVEPQLLDFPIRKVKKDREVKISVSEKNEWYVEDKITWVILKIVNFLLARMNKSFIKNFPSWEKWEWDRNRSFVRIRFRRPTSAQLSRAVKADEISVVEPTQPLRIARQSKDNWEARTFVPASLGSFGTP